jgi:hypothetical protein
MPWDRVRRFVLDLLKRELSRPRASIVAPLVLSSCLGSMSPAMKLDDAVKETNDAARFGRTDLAIERVMPEARTAFVKRHRLWGNDVRIVDVEYGGVEKMSESEAIIVLAFGWYRPGEQTLHTTTVRQTWKNDKGAGPWFLTSEERVAGDIGLLGETVTVVRPERRTEHFETTVIK